MKKTFILTVGLTLCFLANVFSQALTIEWQKTYGGNDFDEITAALPTPDGGYILGGGSYSGISGNKTEASRGGWDYWIVKTNSTGAMEWQKAIGGSDNDYFKDIRVTSDGGYILGGESYSNISGEKTEKSKGKDDYWIVKLNSTGDIEWQKTIGGKGNEVFGALRQIADGGYIIGGTSYSEISGDKTEAPVGDGDYWVLKLSPAGDIEWQNTIGGEKGETLVDLEQTTDGGSVLLGESSSGKNGDKTGKRIGGRDYWVVKLDNTGNILWQNTLGGTGDDFPTCINTTAEGGYIMGGYSYSGISGNKSEPVSGVNDNWVVKLNSSGILEWENTIGGNKDDQMYSVEQTSDGGYLLGCFSSSDVSGDKTQPSINGFNSDYWPVKLNNNGEFEWDQVIGGVENDYMKFAYQTGDGGYVLAGNSYSPVSADKTEPAFGLSDYWIVKLNAEPGVCPVPASLSTTNITSSSAKLEWEAVPGAEKYKIRYKVSDNSTWTEVKTVNSYKKLKDLLSSTQYVWQIKTYCTLNPAFHSEWSEKQYFTTSSLKENASPLSIAAEMHIFPNPASHSFVIEVKLNKEINGTSKVEIINTLGQLVYSADHEVVNGSLNCEINLETKLADGNYMIRVINGNVVCTGKLMVQE